MLPTLNRSSCGLGNRNGHGRREVCAKISENNGNLVWMPEKKKRNNIKEKMLSSETD
jgi:hypothetical protein